jgi:hypothetical protein
LVDIQVKILMECVVCVPNFISPLSQPGFIMVQRIPRGDGTGMIWMMITSSKKRMPHPEYGNPIAL